MDAHTTPLSGGKALAAIGLIGLAVVMLIIGIGRRSRHNDANCLPNMPRIDAPDRIGRVVMPMAPGSYTLSSGFGQRDGGFHKGQDFAASLGTPIYAATDGTVVAAGPASGFGHWIVVDTRLDGQPLSTVYGHMAAAGVLVHAGDAVGAGQHIADVGSEGESSGPHLHFEVIPAGRLAGGAQIDPMPWLAVHTQTHTDDRQAVAPPKVLAGNVATMGLVGSTGYASGCGPQPGAVRLARGSVPTAFEPWIARAATLCPEVTAPLLAAQLQQESGFNPNAQSPAGALGPAQFMPGIWAAHAVDADGTGRKDPHSIPDAVMTQGTFDCELAQSAKAALAHGKLHGDLTELWLSMYNCGPDETLRQGQVCQNAETLNYVHAIPAAARTFAGSDAFGTAVRDEALHWRGTPYVWGGGGPDGPSAPHGGPPGFDCSGLAIRAVAVASGGRIILPRTSQELVHDSRGTSEPLSTVRPGDLVFPAGDAPEHVTVYIGDGNVVHAPQPGDVVKISPLALLGPNVSVRRFG